VAIVLGTKTVAVYAFNNGRTFAHTTDLFGVYRDLEVTIHTAGPGQAVTSCTYNGVAMTLLSTVSNGGAHGCRATVYTMTDPPEGPHNVVYALAGNCTNAATAQAWTGVDPDNPRGIPVTATGNNVTPTVAVVSEADEVVIDACAVAGFGGDTIALGAGQTDIWHANAGAGASLMGATSYEAGAALNTMSWTLNNARNWATMAWALKPIVPYATRQVEYTIDVWDIEQRILDANGHEVPRYKIKPNKWCRIVGLESTTAEVYASNYDDPTLVYFESVTYDGEMDQVQIVTNRGDLPEVMLARLASGSTG